MIPDVLRLLHNHSRSAESDDYSYETSELIFASDQKSKAPSTGAGFDYHDYDLDSNWASKAPLKGLILFPFMVHHTQV